MNSPRTPAPTVLAAALVLLGLPGACERSGSEGPAPAPVAEDATPVDRGPLPEETVLYARKSTLARSKPSQRGEAVMRVSKDERLRYFDEEDGWYRIGDTPHRVVAWIAATDVRTVLEPRGAPLPEQLRGIESALAEKGGARWVARTVRYFADQGVLTVTVSVTGDSGSPREDCEELLAIAGSRAPGYHLSATAYGEGGDATCDRNASEAE